MVIAPCDVILIFRFPVDTPVARAQTELPGRKRRIRKPPTVRLVRQVLAVRPQVVLKPKVFLPLPSPRVVAYRVFLTLRCVVRRTSLGITTELLGVTLVSLARKPKPRARTLKLTSLPCPISLAKS